MKKNGGICEYVVLLVISIVVIAAFCYFLSLPFSFHSLGLWLTILIVVTADVIIIVCHAIDYDLDIPLWPMLGIIFAWGVFAVCVLSGSPIFANDKITSAITVHRGTTNDIPTEKQANSLMLTDTDSAYRLADRTLGSIPEYVSQFEVGNLTTITYKGDAVKVAPLEYASFSRWFNRKDLGTPGYIIVTTNQEGKASAKLVKVKKGMKYVPSACFEDNADRHIHEQMPTQLLGASHMELDEEGNPVFVAAILKHNAGMFNATVTKGAAVLNPVTGEVKTYMNGHIPDWIDVVADGDLLTARYNDYGTYAGGFSNAVFGKNGCTRVTDDYGYLAKGKDMYIFTGVTSVTDDSSNLGFLVGNERTGRLEYIPCAGADEYSAMKAAEGEVQEKGYSASFPSLVMIDNTPTYVCVLKDKNFLVKGFACVMVKDYSRLVVRSSLADTLNEYTNMLGGKQVETTDVSGKAPGTITITDKDGKVVDQFKGPHHTTSEDLHMPEKTVTIKKMQVIDSDGTSYLYILTNNNQILHAKYTDVINMIGVNPGDKITIRTDGVIFTYGK